jgi:hypothetical protein
MNDDTAAVIRFLEALQGFRTKLGELRTELIQKGAKNASVAFNLGIPFRVHKANSLTSTLSGTVSLGVEVTPRTGAPRHFEITIRWDAETWYIDTEIWQDDRFQNQQLVRAFSQRRTTSLDQCIEYIDDAIDDLRASDEFAAAVA